ncbi:hypothetical protein [Micromonospora aurantiaca (nom. illeg.)]|uniref:hypothetical protein n=1 Tax=Micromonospora aurantiaca (nom. illeg.) TaxID=47850 RepID=UPI003F4E2CFA
MRPGTLLRLVLAGTRTDIARVVLTAVSAALATLAGLAALTVLSVVKPSGDEGLNSDQYTNALLREPGLRPGVAFALLLLCVPVLGLAGQCARLGAPGRDRRLAAFRLAGATPGQVTGSRSPRPAWRACSAPSSAWPSSWPGAGCCTGPTRTGGCRCPPTCTRPRWRWQPSCSACRWPPRW